MILQVPRIVLVLVLCAGGLIGGCGSSDSDDSSDSSDLSLSSSDFTAGGSLPSDSACPDLGGNDEIPTLSWSGAPEGTMSFAIVMKDTTNPTTHMVLFNISSSTTSVDDTDDFSASSFAANYLGTRGYAGPCPPAGETHTYVFTLYALDVEDLSDEVSDTSDADAVVDAIEANDLDSDTLSGTFTAP